jgi:hypothetical protein
MRHNFSESNNFFHDRAIFPVTRPDQAVTDPSPDLAPTASATGRKPHFSAFTPEKISL